MKMNIGTYHPVYGQVQDKRYSIKNRIKAAVRWVIVKTAIAGIFAAILLGVYFYGMVEAANTQTVVNTITITPTPKESMSAVMARIAGCESEGNAKAKGKQFNADGSVVTHINDNGSVDLGKYQINLTASHLKQMAKLGMNPLTEEGNEAFAKWIYENEGTGPWASSQHCWQ